MAQGHMKGAPNFLMLIDCGLFRFAAWRLLLQQDSSHVIFIMLMFCCEQGQPEEIFTDNDTTFHSRIQLRLPCVHVPNSNGIVERCHQSIKRITTRKQCTVMEVVGGAACVKPPNSQCSANFKKGYVTSIINEHSTLY